MAAKKITLTKHTWTQITKAGNTATVYVKKVKYHGRILVNHTNTGSTNSLKKSTAKKVFIQGPVDPDLDLDVSDPSDVWYAYALVNNAELIVDTSSSGSNQNR